SHRGQDVRQLRPATASTLRSSPLRRSERGPIRPATRGFRISERKEATINKILGATDGSHSALQAVELGLDLAEEQAAKLVFVHVSPRFEVLPFPITGIGSAPVKVAHRPDEHDT